MAIKGELVTEDKYFHIMYRIIEHMFVGFIQNMVVFKNIAPCAEGIDGIANPAVT